MMPGRPPIMSWVFHPAIAMYSRPFPASSAENWVVSPISFARAVSLRISASDAWEMACTVPIWLSKPMPTLVAAVSPAASPAAAAAPPLIIAPKTLSDIPPKASMPLMLIPPNASSIPFADRWALRSRLSISLRAFLMEAARDESVPPDIMISSS